MFKAPRITSGLVPEAIAQRAAAFADRADARAAAALASLPPADPYVAQMRRDEAASLESERKARARRPGRR